MTVAFLTLFLGLTVGVHPVTVTVAPEVERVRVLLDGEPVGVAEAETGWTVPVDFGDALSPRELTAVAYAARGEELGRTRQAINLARPPAEAEVVIEGDGSGEGVVARLSWESVKPSEPRSVTAVFDGRPLPVEDPRRIELPSHDPNALHFLRVRIEFSDSVAATVEATFGGTYGDRTQTELTAVLVAVQEDGDVLSPQHLEGRLATAEGAPVQAVAVEEGPAEVAFVLGQEAQPALWELARKQILFWVSRYPDRNRRFRRALQHRDESGVERPNTSFWRSEMELNVDQSLYLLWPYAEPVDRSGPSFELFPRSEAHPPDDGGVFWILSEADPPEAPSTEPRLADAAAVAGMTATARSRRRAVVLVVSPDPEDASRFEPGAVRRYLAKLGVPLDVWVIGRPGRAVRRRWGDAVRGVPSVDAFGKAVEDLARRLDRQRIVWVEGSYLPQEIVGTGWMQAARGEEAPEPGSGAPEASAEPAPTPAPALDLEGSGTHRLGPWTVSTDVDDPELLASLDRLATEVDRGFRDRYGVAPGATGHTGPGWAADDGDVLAVDDPAVLSELDHGSSIDPGRLVLPRAGRSDRALRAALLHELVHLLARRGFGTRLPPCLEEALGDDLAFALAESRTEIDRHRLAVHSGGYWRAVEGLVEVLEEGSLPSLARLTGLDWPAMVAPEGWELRYAQCALFVSYLIDGDGGRWRDGFRSYLGEVAEGGGGAPGRLLEALGAGWKTLDGAFGRWLRGRDELTRQEIRIE